MNCQEIQQLLAFMDRKSEELDGPEREALKQHLEKCPDCAELAQAERRADDTLAPLMRDVAVPGNLKQKVMKRLAAERVGVPWNTGIAIAAAILIAVTSGLVWYYRPPPEVNRSDLYAVSAKHHIGMWNADSARDFLKEQGLGDRVPAQFDYEYLQHVDVVELKGRRVAKLTFSKGVDCTAFVLILPWKQFRTTDLKDDGSSLKILKDEEHRLTYLILFSGTLEAVQRKQRTF